MFIVLQTSYLSIFSPDHKEMCSYIHLKAQFMHNSYPIQDPFWPLTEHWKATNNSKTSLNFETDILLVISKRYDIVSLILNYIIIGVVSLTNI